MFLPALHIYAGVCSRHRCRCIRCIFLSGRNKIHSFPIRNNVSVFNLFQILSETLSYYMDFGVYRYFRISFFCRFGLPRRNFRICCLYGLQNLRISGRNFQGTCSELASEHNIFSLSVVFKFCGFMLQKKKIRRIHNTFCTFDFGMCPVGTY